MALIDAVARRWLRLTATSVSTPPDLIDVLAVFARTMVGEHSVQAILDQFVERTVQVLPVEFAGVTLMGSGEAPRWIAASHSTAMHLEHVQAQLDDGPCKLSFRTGEAVLVPDLAHDSRFPAYTRHALDAGISSVFVFPLSDGDEQLGTLDLYSSTARPMDHWSTDAAWTLSDVATAYLVNARSRQTAREISDRHLQSALHDALTGLPNRVLLRERLEHAVLRARRSRRLLSILFVDLDRFKLVNDTHGHATGDELLIAVADRLRGIARPGDTVARMSGDEFVLLCEDFDDTEQVHGLAERVVHALAAPFELATTAVAVTASVGIAFAGPGDEVPDQLLNDADEAMYQAKRAGGARHQQIDLQERDRIYQHDSLKGDLRRSIENGELRLDYQPIVRTSGAEVAGVEALLRWDHPRLGLISPGRLVPLAEQSDAIVSLGRWVLERACTDVVHVRATGRTDLHVSVNVSARQVLASGWVDDVHEVLSRTGMDPAALTLEVTESLYLADVDGAMAVLEQVRRGGIRVALDDFGTGYSSLSYLQRLPIDVLKIDREFIAALGHQPASAAIVETVIRLAHILDLQVVAEGVETADQHHHLAAMAADACQGFYFDRPMSISDLERRLTRDR